MKSFILRVSRNSVAAAAVEFALIAPVLVLMTIGTIQLSIIVFAKHQLADGLDRARRSLQINPTTSTETLKNIVASQTLFGDEQVEVKTETVTLTNGNTMTKLTASVVLNFKIDILDAEWPSISAVSFVSN